MYFYLNLSLRHLCYYTSNSCCNGYAHHLPPNKENAYVQPPHVTALKANRYQRLFL